MLFSSTNGECNESAAVQMTCMDSVLSDRLVVPLRTATVDDERSSFGLRDGCRVAADAAAVAVAVATSNGSGRPFQICCPPLQYSDPIGGAPQRQGTHTGAVYPAPTWSIPLKQTTRKGPCGALNSFVALMTRELDGYEVMGGTKSMEIRRVKIGWKFSV